MKALDRLLAELDEEQRHAVLHREGPLLVVAGAGSGKTRVLTYRVAALLASELARSHEIMAVTFTNKAAREMNERVERLLGSPLSGGFVGTFHRFALQLLRSHAGEAGLPERFVVADEDDQRKLLERALKKLDIGPQQLAPRWVRARVSAAKNALRTPEMEARHASNPKDRLVAEVYAAYQAELGRDGAVDFDDMLLLAVRLLEREEGLCRGLRQRFRFILVDEYQDTNHAQARLLWLVGGSRPNLTAVGDEDQSIYRWRGAEIANILEFEATYPGARIITLGRNYRSTEPILRAADGVIRHNQARRDKKLSSHVGPGEAVLLYQADDEMSEARFVCDAVEAQRRQRPDARIAVLYRVNAQSRPLEAELVRRGVPYEVVAGARFWERAEVKDTLAYLRLLVAPDDALAFRRAIRVPARGIGQVAMDHVERLAGMTRVSLVAAARNLPAELTPRARLAYERFFTLLDGLRDLLETRPPAEVVRALLERSGLAAQYATGEEEDQARRANQDQLVAATAEAAERGLDLRAFLDEVALLSDADARSDGAPVHLSTLHAAKGLEFDTVVLVGLEDGLLPLRREGAIEDLEEERRLAYVGMTRARTRLILTCARQRMVNGQRLSGTASPFLGEIPVDVLAPGSLGHPPRPGRAPSGWTGPAPRASSQPARVESGAPPGVRSGHPEGWRPGLKVQHATFGRGVILQVQGSGAQTRLVVYFDRAGRKTLLPALARLERG